MVPSLCWDLDFPRFCWRSTTQRERGSRPWAAELARRGVAGVMMAGAHGVPRAPSSLPTIDALPEIGPILLVQSAYRLIATLAVRRGYDPDRPAHLRKVTETV